MRVVGDFNNISDVLKAKIVPLKAGQIAEYQLKEFVRIQDPDTKQWETRYPHNQLWARDNIYDSGKESMVEIGVIAPNGQDPITKLIKVCEQFEFDRPRDGLLVLDGNNAFHRELHEHLQMRNDCEGGILGEDRDISVQLKFRLINRKKEAMARRSLRDTKADALTLVKNMDAQEARDFAASMGWDDFNGELEVVMDKISELADTDPLAFKTIIEDPLTKKKSIIKKAIGISITIDHANYSVKWLNGEVIASLERRPNENEITAFAKWLNTATNGDKILGRLRNQKAAQPATVS